MGVNRTAISNCYQTERVSGTGCLAAISRKWAQNCNLWHSLLYLVSQLRCRRRFSRVQSGKDDCLCNIELTVVGSYAAIHLWQNWANRWIGPSQISTLIPIHSSSSQFCSHYVFPYPFNILATLSPGVVTSLRRINQKRARHMKWVWAPEISCTCFLLGLLLLWWVQSFWTTIPWCRSRSNFHFCRLCESVIANSNGKICAQ
jgi:hypothetical protein